MGLLGKLIRFITGQNRSRRISPKVELNNLPALKTFILEPIITPSGVVDSSHFSEPLFESGFFTVGAKGEVGVDYLFDGGGYEGELAIFSLKDLEQYDVSTSQGLHDFIQVVAERALSDSELGHIVISDAAEGARFSGMFPSEWHDWNAGEYQGVKTFNMHPGDTFGVMLVPNATVQELYDNPDAGGAVRPLFSMVTANPSEAFHLGQAVDVNGKATTFVLEDQRFDQGSDRDYEDIIFQFHGATGKAANMDNFVNHDVDWRGSELGQKLMEFIKPPANQPLIGIIDTGVTADNPDLDPYHIHFGNHADLVAGDGNPLLQSGEGSEHGTHIAGIIAATQDNGLGIDGINDQAPLYISRATGSGNWAQGLVDFVDAAKESGQPHAIANLSLDLTQINHDGSVTTRYEFTPFEREALEYARQNHVLIVAAAGNDGDVMSVLGQASQEFDNIITTGAAKHLDLSSDHAVPIAEAYDRADYSSYGYGLDILADGGTVENPILSTVGDGLGTLTGTSVATAQVTGAASLVWAANPDLDYRQVIEILKSTATDLKTPGWDVETGSGLLNIAAAVELAKRTTPEVYNPAAFLAPTTWDGEGQVLPWERAASDFVSVSFDGNVTADIGAIIRDRPSKSNGLIASRAAYGENLSFDGWVDGEYISYSGLKSTTKWYRIAGNPNQWISGAIIDSDPPAVVNNTPSNNPGNQNNTSTENNNTTVVVEVPTNENSNNYTDIPSVTEPPKPTFTVSEPFYSVWQKYQGFIGSPIENVQTFSGNVTYQRFDNGSIISSSHGTFALYGGIRQAYLNTGGLNGWLGAPTSPITEDPSHNGVLKQKFEHGYIIWNGNKATAYKVNENPKITYLDFNYDTFKLDAEPNFQLISTKTVSNSSINPSGSSNRGVDKIIDFLKKAVSWLIIHGTVKEDPDIEKNNGLAKRTSPSSFMDDNKVEPLILKNTRLWFLGWTEATYLHDNNKWLQVVDFDNNLFWVPAYYIQLDLDYLPDFLKIESGVNWDFINEQEAFSLNGNVPKVDKSGVTIAHGFDIGQYNKYDLTTSIRLPPDLVDKYKPYLGLIRKDAENALKKKPLEITQKEADITDKLVHLYKIGMLEPLYNQDSKVRFRDLPPEAQTVIASVAYQKGERGVKDWKEFWDAVTKQNWQKAKTALENAQGYSSRRKAEANYLLPLIS